LASLGLWLPFPAELNLTHHGNFNQVYNNVTSPRFGNFAGFEPLQTAFLLSVVN
jgi:hypothetical protein